MQLNKTHPYEAVFHPFGQPRYLATASRYRSLDGAKWAVRKRLSEGFKGIAVISHVGGLVPKVVEEINAGGENA